MLHINLHLKWVGENEVNEPGSRNYKGRISDSRQLFLEQLKGVLPIMEQCHSCSTDLHFFQSTSRFLELRSSLVGLGIFAINGGLFFVASWQFFVVVVDGHCSPQKSMNFTGHFPENSNNNLFAVLPIGMYTTKLFTF